VPSSMYLLLWCKNLTVASVFNKVCIESFKQAPIFQYCLYIGSSIYRIFQVSRNRLSEVFQDREVLQFNEQLPEIEI